MIDKMKEHITKFYNDEFMVEESNENQSCYKITYCDGTWFLLNKDVVTEDTFDQVMDMNHQANNNIRSTMQMKQEDPEKYEKLHAYLMENNLEYRAAVEIRKKYSHSPMTND